MIETVQNLKLTIRMRSVNGQFRISNCKSTYSSVTHVRCYICVRRFIICANSSEHFFSFYKIKEHKASWI